MEQADLKVQLKHNVTVPTVTPMSAWWWGRRAFSKGFRCGESQLPTCTSKFRSWKSFCFRVNLGFNLVCFFLENLFDQISLTG